MQLYYSDILSSRKACAVARYLKSPVEFRYLDLVKGDQQKPAYLAVNPNGKVPTLIDGEHVVWEADAVICYLAKVAGSDLWPDDLRQIDIIRWFSWNAQHFYRHAGTLYFENIVKRRFGIGEPDAAAVREAQQEFRRYAAVLTEHLEDRQLAGRRRPHRGRFFGGHHAAVCRPGRHAAGRIPGGAALARPAERNRSLARAVPAALTPTTLGPRLEGLI